MPIEWLVRYWDKTAGPVLPFLRDRKVAVEQIFDHKTILRRHGDRGLPHSSPNRLGFIASRGGSDSVFPKRTGGPRQSENREIETPQVFLGEVVVLIQWLTWLAREERCVGAR